MIMYVLGFITGLFVAVRWNVNIINLFNKVKEFFSKKETE